MTARTRLVFIGGFLGAGKTTLINKMAQQFMNEKTVIGVVTNDQGQLLVDTEFVKVRGINVKEVPGGCFCCNFPKLLDNSEKLVKETKPEYIIAEPVGSCTDLIATVATPMKMYHGDTFSVCPLIVLVDGPKMLNESLDPKTLGGYLRKHQVSEAECLVLTKIDELGPDDVKKLVAELNKINPEAKVITYSALTDEGFKDIMKIVKGKKETCRKPVDVDYDKYAKAEAELGWYNGVFEFNAKNYDSYDLSMALLKCLARRYPAESIAHAKVSFMSGSNETKVSLIGNEFSIGGVYGSRFGNGKSQLNFNARIISEPDALRAAIRDTVDRVFKEKGIKYSMKFDDCFSPGRPNPTYRITN
jgi:G3E family GTPase